MDVEFLGPDGRPVPVDEELLTSRPPRRPRWRMVGALGSAVAALAVLGTVAGGEHGGSPAPSGQPSDHAPTVQVPPRIIRPMQVFVPTGSPAVELDGQVIFEAGSQLHWASVDGTSSFSLSIDDAQSYELHPDAVHHQVLVLLDGAQSNLLVVPSRGPAAQPDVGLQSELSAGAVLDGEMYVSTPDRIYRLTVEAESGSYAFSSLPARGGSDVTADPVRHRLLIMEIGRHASVRAQRPAAARPERTAPLPFGKGSVVATRAGQIWAAGYSDHGAVLDRLDPMTLRVVARSPAAAQLGPGAVVVGVGRASLLVRSGSGGDGLWCVDSRTGAVARHWTDVPGAIAMGPDGGFQITSTGIAPALLTGGRCPA